MAYRPTLGWHADLGATHLERRTFAPGCTPKGRGVAYLVAPEFGDQVLQRVDPALYGGAEHARPWALLDDQGCVLTLNALAAANGVAPGQTESQAVARCPLVTLRPASHYPIFEVQAEFLARVARYAGRWQPAGLGCAYLDTEGLGAMGQDEASCKRLAAWCQALAADIRDLGLTSSLGLTGSKFGAFAAGRAAGCNAMLLMASVIERSFLAAQSVSLLPLDAATLLHLRHLGIRSLGDYARLPTAGVLARFGEAGRTAQRWAQGCDERPVILPDELPQVSSRIEFETPVIDRGILLDALLQRVAALLAPLHANLQGVGGQLVVGTLSLVVLAADKRTLTVNHTFQLPTAAIATIRLALAAALDRFVGQPQLARNGEGVSEVTLTLGDISDAPVQQLSLFDEGPTSRAALTILLDQLAARFGPHTFQMAALTDPNHPLPERRASWKEFSQRP